MMGEVEISICNEDDWKEARKCLIRAFWSYPLYVQLIRDNNKRALFLGNYFEAIYEVTVRRGNSVLICVKIPAEPWQSSNSNEKIIIGAVLLVPPSSNGGWQCAKDEEFWEAYEKFQLKEIDEESLLRIKHYERWEYENITMRICKSGIPMWNGILCGVDPAYASRGWGSKSYYSCLRLIQNLHFTKMGSPAKSLRLPLENMIQKLSNLFQTRIEENFEEAPGVLVKFLHSLSFLSHRAPIIPDFTTGQNVQSMSSAVTENSCSPPPVIFALSHSIQSAQFHNKNGFSTIVRRTYKAVNSENTNTMTVTSMLMQLPQMHPPSTVMPRVIPCLTSSFNGNHDEENGVSISDIIAEDTINNYSASWV